MIYVDAPLWQAHGTVFAHLVSDRSYAELHAFAARVGLDPRSWDGDHYDVPLRRYDDVVAAGAQVVDGRTLARLLSASGLRVRKRKGERPLVVAHDVVPGLDVPHRLDVLASTLEAPAPVVAAATFVRDARGALLLVRSVRRDAWEAPGGGVEPGESAREAAVREVHEETGLALDPSGLAPVGYERLHLESPAGRWPAATNHVAVYATRTTATAPPVRPRAGETDAVEWVGPQEVARRCREAVWWPLLARLLEQA